MIPIDYKHPFSLLFCFEDLDGIPVDVSEADIVFWISTRKYSPPFKAICSPKASLNAALTDKSSVVVSLNNHDLHPGRLQAIINIYSDEAEINPHHHHCHHDSNDSLFSISPDIRAELLDFSVIKVHHCEHNPDKPIRVVCRFNVRNPHLVKHVTKADLKKEVEEAVKSIEGRDTAEVADIQFILDKFSSNDE